jgi:hypothetical protein
VVDPTALTDADLLEFMRMAEKRDDDLLNGRASPSASTMAASRSANSVSVAAGSPVKQMASSAKSPLMSRRGAQTSLPFLGRSGQTPLSPTPLPHHAADADGSAPAVPGRSSLSLTAVASQSLAHGDDAAAAGRASAAHRPLSVSPPVTLKGSPRLQPNANVGNNVNSNAGSSGNSSSINTVRLRRAVVTTTASDVDARGAVVQLERLFAAMPRHKVPTISALRAEIHPLGVRAGVVALVCRSRTLHVDAGRRRVSARQQQRRAGARERRATRHRSCARCARYITVRSGAGGVCVCDDCDDQVVMIVTLI